MRLARIGRQVIVVTGASSGIGLATAKLAAARGARGVVLCARSEDGLGEAVEQIRAAGGRATSFVADVADAGAMDALADHARAAFGGFDTWVNNAGVSVYGPCLTVPLADMRRLFDTNVWGVIHGSRIACEHLVSRGGALINVGSEVSDKAVPLQGAYSASKHAVKGWTDALRMELEQSGMPVSVTLIKPGPIDTPYTRHARNYLEDEPTHAPPVYTPEAVAEAIVHAAQTPVRDLFVGGGARFVAALDHWTPRLGDRIVGRMVSRGTHSGRPRTSSDALYQAGGGLQERGDYDGMVRRSLYTTAAMHPLTTGAVAIGATLLLGTLMRGKDARQMYETSH
jgi:NAD(P)-dependent dehydrogenase (short-subunit alcohol dehydrogenase family)